MGLLRGGVAVHADQPRFAGDQQLMQGAERRQRDLRSPNPEPHASDRIELPRRQDRHDTRRQLDVHKLARGAPFALNATRIPPIERMPAIMDHDVLPDMGRMTVRSPSGAATGPSAVPTPAATEPPSCTR